MKFYLPRRPFLGKRKRIVEIFSVYEMAGVHVARNTYWYPIWLLCATGVVVDVGYQARLVASSKKLGDVSR